MKTQNFNQDHTLGKDAEWAAIIHMGEYHLNALEYITIHDTKKQQKTGDVTFTFKNGDVRTYDMKFGRKKYKSFYAEIWSNYGYKPGWLVTENVDYIVQTFGDNDFYITIDFDKLRSSLNLRYNASHADIRYAEVNCNYPMSNQNNVSYTGMTLNTGQTINIPWSAMKPFITSVQELVDGKLVQKSFTDFLLA
ncbi:hypothetical protein [Gluconobacter albidus]|uniref:Uncharacterized protein n=1 Tax=Gluconobacter albidus TaxID=318683 RepID=A0AAW3R0H0_9PROT|nr:hypothetical protein [Gluconobacter albidus]KXV42013.1 hypothetical protein AD941_02080 [Gluconobacter albidus]GBQ92630.1 hypothetical protein AA3250_2626 [Gluconobacter albidus NBRC 3250]GLQ68081.1 hypothetical protein GCM10007866_05290 [Gluconobacter albidus]